MSLHCIRQYSPLGSVAGTITLTLDMLAATVGWVPGGVAPSGGCVGGVAAPDWETASDDVPFNKIGSPVTPCMALASDTMTEKF